MYRVPGKIIVVSTPRTASRTTAKLLMDNEETAHRLSLRHHASIMEVNTARKVYDEPLVTFTRHPVAHIQSMLHLEIEGNRTPKTRLIRINNEIVPRKSMSFSFKDWVTDSNHYIAMMRLNGRVPMLNCYAQHVDHVLLLEDGITEGLSRFGLDVHEEEQHIGDIGEKRTRYDKVMTEENIALSKQYFPYDWEVYEKALESREV